MYMCIKYDHTFGVFSMSQSKEHISFFFSSYLRSSHCYVFDIQSKDSIQCCSGKRILCETEKNIIACIDNSCKLSLVQLKSF